MAEYTAWENVPIVMKLATAAKVLDVHNNTVHNLIKGGELRAKKVGREWRITKEDLMGYLGLCEPDPCDRLREVCRLVISYLEVQTQPDSDIVKPTPLTDARTTFLKRLTQQLREALGEDVDTGFDLQNSVRRR